MLVIEVGVKFRTVSVKCANIFDQDCRFSHSRFYGLQFFSFPVLRITAFFIAGFTDYNFLISDFTD